MKVSLIVPTYNRRELLRETIESIVNQSYTNWELIVVDDGSSDGTDTLVGNYCEQDKRIGYFQRPSGMAKGPNSCRNFGFLRSAGELVKWVDSDDLLAKDALQNQVEVFKTNPTIKLCLGYGSIFFDNPSSTDGLWSRSNRSDDYFADHIRSKIRWPIGGILWKRTIFKAVPFRANLKNSQEWLLHSQSLLQVRSNEIYNFTDVVYFVRKGHLRLSSSNTAGYSFHQAKARIVLFVEMLRQRHPCFLNYFEVIKQVLINSFYGFSAVVRSSNLFPRDHTYSE
ncbi:glycosyltransferase family 2 protein [Cyclobacterium xiamenense]|uniref:glycosyltransferase family 2 protein n=1 Tax=Cyclobacterium xiamenense TaxID=1297121 RepID=UPI0035CEBCE4